MRRAPHASPCAPTRPAGRVRRRRPAAAPSGLRRAIACALACALAGLPAVRQAAAQGPFAPLDAFRPLNGDTPPPKVWFYGVANDEVKPDENDQVLESLKRFKPWKDIPAAQTRLRDDVGGRQILDDLAFFHDNVKAGDIFVFWYGGHSATRADDNADEPAPPDPLPRAPPGGVAPTPAERRQLYRDDEMIGRAGDWATDDQLAADQRLGSFPDSATVIVIFNTCMAGGFLGGTSDLDRAAIAAKRNMLFIGSVPESILCPRLLGIPKLENVFDHALAAATCACGCAGCPFAGKARASALANAMNEEWKSNFLGGNPSLVIWNNLNDAHDRVVAECTPPTTGGGQRAEQTESPLCPSAVPEPRPLLLLAAGLSLLAVAGGRRRAALSARARGRA